MKAILLRQPGGPTALEYVELPTPVPGDGEVLVQADTIGVSMPEVLVRKGVYNWMPPLPAIPGIEMSGIVVAQGRNVAAPAIGQPVFISARDLPVRAGCYAEYIAVPARAAYPLPPDCSLEAAACLSNYQVAYHVLHTAARGITAESVLIHNAASPALRFFSIHSFDDRPDIRAATMKTLLGHLAAGEIRPLIHDRLPLADAARAHQLLEAGAVIGKLLLKP